MTTDELDLVDEIFGPAPGEPSEQLASSEAIRWESTPLAGSSVVVAPRLTPGLRGPLARSGSARARFHAVGQACPGVRLRPDRDSPAGHGGGPGCLQRVLEPGRPRRPGRFGRRLRPEPRPAGRQAEDRLRLPWPGRDHGHDAGRRVDDHLPGGRPRTRRRIHGRRGDADRAHGQSDRRRRLHAPNRDRRPDRPDRGPRRPGGRCDPRPSAARHDPGRFRRTRRPRLRMPYYGYSPATTRARHRREGDLGARSSTA